MSGLYELSGQQIYDNFQQGAGPQRLSQAAAEVNTVVDVYQDRAKQIGELIAEMNDAWQGDAAGGAQRGAGPLWIEHLRAGDHFHTAQDLTGRQAGSFSDAKNQVVPVPPAPDKVPPFGMLDPGFVPYRAQVEEHNTAAQHNVDVMNSYTGASTYNTDGLPKTYGTLADDQAGITIGSGPTTIDSDDFGDSGGGSGGDGGSRGSGPGPGPGGGAPGGGQDSPAPRPGTDTGSAPGDGTTTPGGYTPAPGGVAGTPGGSLPPGDLGAGQGRGPAGGMVPGMGVGFPGSGGGSGGGGGPRGTGGAPGGGAAGGPRGAAPGGGAGAGAQGPGARPTPAAGGLAGPGRGGGAGMGGVPMGAGRGRGDEDTERKTPDYLEGGDPYELFDSDLVVAPPTIGEDDD